MKSIRAAAIAAILAFSAQSAIADVVGFENFDGGAINLSITTNVFDNGAGGGGNTGDVFGRVEPFVTGAPFDLADDSVAGVSGAPFLGDSRGVIGQNSTAVFGMVDSDGNIDGAGNPLNDAVWSFDISGAVTLDSIMMDIGAMGDFEESSTDGFLVEAQIDGGGYFEIFKGRTYMDSANISMTYRPMDDGMSYSENDPLELSIDGIATGTLLDKSDAATGLMDTFTSLGVAGLSGTTLDIRISWAGSPSGSEAMAFDNFTINGTVPEPGTLALLGLGGIALIRRRR